MIACNNKYVLSIEFLPRQEHPVSDWSIFSTPVFDNHASDHPEKEMHGVWWQYPPIHHMEASILGISKFAIGEGNNSGWPKGRKKPVRRIGGSWKVPRGIFRLVYTRSSFTHARAWSCCTGAVPERKSGNDIWPGTTWDPRTTRFIADTDHGLLLMMDHAAVQVYIAGDPRVDQRYGLRR